MIHHKDRGSITAEVVVLIPALICLVSLIVYAARLTDASNSLYRAVDAGARGASQVSANKMKKVGTTLAREHLASRASSCVRSRVNLTEEGSGRFRLITVRASCTVNRSGIGILTLPSLTLTAESTEVIDFYTQR